MLPTHCINSSFTVSPEMLTTIFSFHFVVDRELRIVQAGDVLQRICFGTLVSSYLDQYVQISRPKIDFTFDSIKKRMKSVFVLEAQHNGMCLTGQMSYSESDDLIFFWGRLGSLTLQILIRWELH